MTITRVSDSLAYSAVIDRSQQLQVEMRQLESEISSGKRVLQPEDDPIGAAQIVQSNSTLAALGQQLSSSQFGQGVLGAEDNALGQANDLMVRANEIASELSSGAHTQDERDAAAEEVHGLLQQMTVLGNTEFSGRRVFAGLALDAPPPFADPDSPGYDPATAYSGSTQEFEVNTGNTASQRVRLTTTGDQVFGPALQSLQGLETALRTPGGDVAGTIAALDQGRNTLEDERASVGARENQLTNAQTGLQSLQAQVTSRLSQVQDADLATVVTQLLQAQQALQAVLSTAAQVRSTALNAVLQA
jgi:flagellar hook-associated protein 3 FlgL